MSSDMLNQSSDINPVTVVGAEWCGDTRAAVATLEELGVPFNFVDVDEDPRAAQWVGEQNAGKIKLPTIKVGNQILSIPDPYQLQAAIQEFLPLAGPAGKEGGPPRGGGDGPPLQ